MGPDCGETAALVTTPTPRSPSTNLRSRFGRRFELHRHQLAGHAPVPAMQDADDDFLPDVATLRRGDRPRLDARFEGNRVGGHVDAEQRIRRLDAGRGQRLWPHRERAPGRERGNEIVVAAGAEERAVAGHAKLIDAREDQRLSGKGHVAVTVLRPLAEP